MFQIAPYSWKDEKKAGVIFVNDKPQPIGTNIVIAGCKVADVAPDAVMTFTSVESIEVVERALSKAKILLRNIDL